MTFAALAIPSRRSVLAAISGAVSNLVSSALASPARLGRATRRPNVLMISIDDLNDWPLGAYPGVRAPTFDRMRSMLRCYTNAATPAAACSPARCATMFGVAPWVSGVYNNRGDWYSNPVLSGRPSIPRYFRDRGYLTFGTGKLFHSSIYNNPADPSRIDPDAWTHFEFCRSQDCYERGEPKPTTTVAGISYMGLRRDAPLEEMPDWIRARWAAEHVLAKRHDKPFLLGVGIRKPHLPLVAPQRFWDLYDRKELVYPPGVLDRDEITFANKDYADLDANARRFQLSGTGEDYRAILESGHWLDLVHGYLAAISFSDHCVGEIIDGLLSGPNADDTVVVFYSDHGWQLGEKLAWQKATLWERALRVPLMIGGAGIRGGDDPTCASLLDIYPTLTRLAFDEAPGYLDGRSLDRNLLSRSKDGRRSVSSWVMNRNGPWPAIQAGPHFSVRTETHRYIEYRDGGRELYDHRVDPWEHQNLVRGADPRHAAMARDMAKSVPVRWAAI